MGGNLDMILYNPTNENVQIQYQGVVHTLDSKETKEFSDEVGTFWKFRVHSFLETKEKPPVLSIPEVKVEVKEVTPEVAEVKSIPKKVIKK